MSIALEITGLTKRYGNVVALDGIDIAVEEGSIYGFLGPNGAGKTTTLRIVTGLARADAGSVSIFGQDAGTSAVRAITGFLPDVPGFYHWMTAREVLRFTAGLFGLDRAVAAERIELLLDLAGLSHVDARVGGYSRGMKQRLGIAQALINAPRLLLLDEPTSALDPLGRKDVLDMVASLSGRTTVFFSTHILADVERVCDTVAVLDRGRVVAQSPLEELKQRFAARSLVIEVADGAQRLRDAVDGKSWARSVTVTDDGSVEVVTSDIDVARVELPVLIGQMGLALRRFDAGETSLEDAFIELVGGER